MDPVSGALGLLPSKLLELLQAEYNLQKSVRVQVQSLSRELEVIHSTLRRVAAEPPDMLNEQVKNWAREAREASYNFEDRIDTFFVRVVDGCREPIEETGSRWLKSAKKKKKKKMGDLPTKGRAPDDIAAAIEDMMKQLQELNERVRGYTTDDILLRPVTSTSSTVDPRLPAMYRNERELVGIEEVRDELVRLLTQGDAEDDKKREVKVVSIVGLAGVGKTTLAKAVYNRLQVQEQFDCSAFVSVSRNPDWKKVFWDMLLELDEAMYQMGIYTEKRAMDVKQLTDEIRRFLENRRYVIRAHHHLRPV
jgi:disease resistance protein RPM1